MCGYRGLSRRMDLRRALRTATCLLALGIAAAAVAPAGEEYQTAVGNAPAVRVRAALVGGPLAEAVNLGWGVREKNAYGNGSVTTSYRRAVPTPAPGVTFTYGHQEPNVGGQKTTYDTVARLTTVLGPDEASIARIFGGALRAAPEELASQTAAGKATTTWEAPRVELLWPKDRPQYYLEQVEADLYRRIELRDKEGYVVEVRPSGTLPQLTVEVALAKNTITGGKYDESIRAEVGRPVLIESRVTSTVALTPGEPVLVVWQPESRAAVAQRDQALAAQQMAAVLAQEDRRAQTTAQLDEAATDYSEILLRRTPNHPRVIALQQQIAGLERQLAEAEAKPDTPADIIKETKARLEKELAELQDALLTGRPEDRETAKVQRRIQEIERQLTELQAGRVPGWAVGGWNVSVGEEQVQRPIVITHRGEVSPLAPDFIVQGEAGERVVDPTGRVQLQVEFAGEPGAFTGQVKPDGTARGIVLLKDGETAAWTAARIGGPVADETAAGAGLAPTVAAGQPPEAGKRLGYSFGPSGLTALNPATEAQPGQNVDLFALPQQAVRLPTGAGVYFPSTLPGTAPTGVAVLLEVVTEGKPKP